MSFITVGIEGLCFAGKSTLARDLFRSLTHRIPMVLSDYTDFIAPAALPLVPARTSDEELVAFRLFIQAEELRWRQVDHASVPPRVVIQDRCVHTLLAHVYANEHISGVTAFNEARRIALDTHVRFPDIVLYLDTSQEMLTNRYLAIPNQLPVFFKSAPYMSHFRRYFSSLADQLPQAIFFLDANETTAEVHRAGTDVLRALRVC
jgi:thymidylate kinase